jgi:PilZ domain
MGPVVIAESLSAAEFSVPHSPEKRGYRRFELEYAVHILFRSEESVSTVDGFTRNVSVGGLLLEAPTLIPPHSKVAFVMNLQGSTLPPAKLMGEGRVVRVAVCAAADRFAIAVECENPITQIQRHLPNVAG